MRRNDPIVTQTGHRRPRIADDMLGFSDQSETHFDSHIRGTRSRDHIARAALIVSATAAPSGTASKRRGRPPRGAYRRFANGFGACAQRPRRYRTPFRYREMAGGRRP